MTLPHWFAFLSVSLAATFSPGPAVLLAMSTSMSIGARRAFFSSAGNGLGIFIVSCLAVTGAGILLRTSETAFSILKFAGAAYLIYLGLKQLKPVAPSQPELRPAANGTGRALFLRGLLVALSNPKSILFFSAVFPQFMDTVHPNPGQFFLLSLTFVACSFLAHFSYMMLARGLSSGRLSGTTMRNVNLVSGVIFIGLGCAMLTLSAQPRM